MDRAGVNALCPDDLMILVLGSGYYEVYVEVVSFYGADRSALRIRCT